MSERDEAYKRIEKVLRFPLLHAEMEELLDICAKAWDQGFGYGVMDQAIYEKLGLGADHPLATNPYKES